MAPPLEEGDERAEAFPAAADRVGDIAFDRRVERRGLGGNSPIDFVELRLDRLKDATQRSGHAVGGGGWVRGNFHKRRIEGRLLMSKLRAAALSYQRRSHSSVAYFSRPTRRRVRRSVPGFLFARPSEPGRRRIARERIRPDPGIWMLP